MTPIPYSVSTGLQSCALLDSFRALYATQPSNRQTLAPVVEAYASIPSVTRIVEVGAYAGRVTSFLIHAVLHRVEQPPKQLVVVAPSSPVLRLIALFDECWRVAGLSAGPSVTSTGRFDRLPKKKRRTSDGGGGGSIDLGPDDGEGGDGSDGDDHVDAAEGDDPAKRKSRQIPFISEGGSIDLIVINGYYRKDHLLRLLNLVQSGVSQYMLIFGTNAFRDRGARRHQTAEEIVVAKAEADRARREGDPISTQPPSDTDSQGLLEAISAFLAAFPRTWREEVAFDAEIGLVVLRRVSGLENMDLQEGPTPAPAAVVLRRRWWEKWTHSSGKQAVDNAVKSARLGWGKVAEFATATRCSNLRRLATFITSIGDSTNDGGVGVVPHSACVNPSVAESVADGKWSQAMQSDANVAAYLESWVFDHTIESLMRPLLMAQLLQHARMFSLTVEIPLPLRSQGSSPHSSRAVALAFVAAATLSRSLEASSLKCVGWTPGLPVNTSTIPAEYEGPWRNLQLRDRSNDERSDALERNLLLDDVEIMGAVDVLDGAGALHSPLFPVMGEVLAVSSQTFAAMHREFERVQRLREKEAMTPEKLVDALGFRSYSLAAAFELVTRRNSTDRILIFNTGSPLDRGHSSLAQIHVPDSLWVRAAVDLGPAYAADPGAAGAGLLLLERNGVMSRAAYVSGAHIHGDRRGGLALPVDHAFGD